MESRKYIIYELVFKASNSIVLFTFENLLNKISNIVTLLAIYVGEGILGNLSVFGKLNLNNVGLNV